MPGVPVEGGAVAEGTRMRNYSVKRCQHAERAACHKKQTSSKSSYNFGPNSLITAATSFESRSLVVLSLSSDFCCPGISATINGLKDL
jgi:hypothetical protein